MNKFPFFLNPYPDELLLSYIIRTLQRNGIDLDVFEKYYVGKRLFKIDKFSFDAKQAFWAFYQSLSFDHEVDAGEFFLSLSTFPFQSLFMTRERQMHYINNVFRKVDRLIPAIFRLHCDEKILAIRSRGFNRRLLRIYQGLFHAISLSMRAYSSLEQGFVFPYSSH